MNCTNEEEEARVRAIAGHFRAILELIGENPGREGLLKTPERAARALVRCTSGMALEGEDVVNGAVFKQEDNGMVVVKDIEFYSLCEHHVLPFFGHMTVAYVPNGKILGLSKVARIVEVYARRLQVQERLCADVCSAMMRVLGSDDVMCVCRAGHLCMKMRGVEKQDSETLTVTKRGVFEKDPYVAMQVMNG